MFVASKDRIERNKTYLGATFFRSVFAQRSFHGFSCLAVVFFIIGHQYNAANKIFDPSEEKSGQTGIL
jgi:hypothetical protein